MFFFFSGIVEANKLHKADVCYNLSHTLPSKKSAFFSSSAHDNEGLRPETKDSNSEDRKLPQQLTYSYSIYN